MVEKATPVQLGQDIIKLIKLNTSRSNYEAWKILQQHFIPQVSGFLSKRGLREQDIKQEVLNEALAALFQNVLQGTFRGDAALGTYLTKIATNKWLKWLQKNRPKLKARNVSAQNLEELNELDQVQLFLKGELPDAAADKFKQRMAQDTSLQEVVAIVRDSIGIQQGLQTVSLETDKPETSDEEGENKREALKTFIERVFPSGHNCPELLIEYYFVHEANYDRITYATKRKREDFDTVYERVKKQINRCLKALREQRK